MEDLAMWAATAGVVKGHVQAGREVQHTGFLACGDGFVLRPLPVSENPHSNAHQLRCCGKENGQGVRSQRNRFNLDGVPVK